MQTMTACAASVLWGMPLLDLECYGHSSIALLWQTAAGVPWKTRHGVVRTGWPGSKICSLHSAQGIYLRKPECFNLDGSRLVPFAEVGSGQAHLLMRDFPPAGLHVCAP